jgi:hypothetical protein
MFVIQIIDADGEIRYVQVRAASAGEARNLAAAQAGLSPSERIGTVASPLFFESQNVALPQNIQEITGAAQPPASQPPRPPVIDPDITPLQGNVQAPIATEEQSLFANFLRGLQDRGAGLSGIAGQARVNRFQPLQAQFLAEQVLNPGVAGTPLSFAEFSRTAPLAGAQQGQRAVQLFNQALQRSRGLSPIGAEFDALTEREQGFLNPTTSGQAQALEDLSRAAARQQFGVASEFFRPNVDLFQQFQAQARPTAQSFADFLNQRIFGG